MRWRFFLIEKYVDAQKFIEKTVCSIKNDVCCSGQCSECPGLEYYEVVWKSLSEIPEIMYHQWDKTEKNYQKVELVDSGADVVEYVKNDIPSIRTHVYNIYRQHSELKFLKENLKPNEVILSVDFSKNYENKQRHEIQSAYFGHEAFTIFTAACYYKSSDDPEVKEISVVIISNETQHERNIAFTCNQKLIEFIRAHFPAVDTIYFWSDGCSGQFRSKYVFKSLLSYPADLNISWDYGEAHHFKGPHDGIGGCVKRKVYQDVSAAKVVIQNASHFAEYAKSVCNIHVLYLDQADIIQLDLSSAIYVYGTLKIHHVKRISPSTLHFCFNSNYKRESPVYRELTYEEFEIDTNEQNNTHEVEEVENHQQVNLSTVAGDLVIVKYVTTKKQFLYLGLIQNKTNETLSVQFLKSCGEKTFTIKDNDCDEVTNDNIVAVVPSNKFVVNSRGQYIMKDILKHQLDM